jgi:hypothetical protein
MKIRFIGTVSVVCLLTTAATCQTQDCSKALVIAYTGESSSVTSQLSAAYHMSESEWKQRRAGGSANAEIYGIPMGARYSDFRNNVRQRAEDFHLERFEQRSYSYATSGLNNESLQAYKACLQTVAKGVYLLAGDISPESYNILLTNEPYSNLDKTIVGSIGNPINISDASLAYLKQQVSGLQIAESWDKEIRIQPKDLTKEVTFAVEFGGLTKDILLPPLSVKPPRIDLSNSAHFELKHRVNGVPHPDCALGTPEGGIGGLSTDYISDNRACITTAGKNLPANFKIDPKTVSISAPGQSCAWVVCPEASGLR